MVCCITKQKAMMVVFVLLVSLCSVIAGENFENPVGWVTKFDGFSGGGNAKPTVVKNYKALKEALTSGKDKVVYVDGIIHIPENGLITVQNISGKTIVGLPGAKLISTDISQNGSGILYFKSCNNIILKNIIFEGPGAYDVDGYDNLCLDDCRGVWVDHCEFYDGLDGNFDIKNKSDLITVTWCIFGYKIVPKSGGSGGADDHRCSNLIGHSTKAIQDEGKLNVTFQYCWWQDGCAERMPRVRLGKVHVVNNLFTSSVAIYDVRAGYKANILVENNYFDKQKLPVDEFKNTYTAIKADNNIGCNDIHKNKAFVPSYKIVPDDPKDIVSPIKSDCGATLNIKLKSNLKQ